MPACRKKGKAHPTQGNRQHVIHISGCDAVLIGEKNVVNFVDHPKDVDQEYGEEYGEEYLTRRDMSVEDKSELVQFVGRQGGREKIKTAIHNGRRLIQLYGQAMVGKSRLARQVVLELKNERKDEHMVVHVISCLQVKSWEEFLARFVQHCFSKSIGEINQDNILQNCQAILNHLNPLLLFTNCEILDRNPIDAGNTFQRFILEFLKKCPNASVIVTSQKRYDLECGSHDICVEPLNPSDIMQLLQYVLPGIDIQPFKAVVFERCYGLPPYILDAAACIKGNINLQLTSSDLETCLQNDNRSKRIHLEISSDGNTEPFPGLSAYLQQKVIDLTIFRGSFGLESCEAVLGSSGKQDLIELQKRSVITTISKTNGAPRLSLTEYFVYLSSTLKDRVTYNDIVRLKFVKFFGEILSRANLDLYITSQQTVYGYLKDDWLNLEQVLKEAIHCTDNTYHAFLNVAVDADNLIVKCFPGEALSFYQTMVDVTDDYGTQIDKAVLNAKLGRAITHTKGDDLERGKGLLNAALDVLKDTGASMDLVTLLHDLAFNIYKGGQYQEALECCKDALETADKMELTPKLINQIIAIRSLLAIPHTFLGHFETAENLLMETLDLTEKFAPFHPSKSIMINSLGVLYERSNEDDDLALQFYRASLVERRKFENMFPADLVISLNNIGMQYSKRGQHRQALRHLEEAYTIRLRIGKMDFNTALTLWHMGRVHMLLCNIPKATNLLNEAIHIYNTCSRHHGVHVHVRLVLAHCHVLQNHFMDARQCLREAIGFSEDFIKQSPKSPHLLFVMGHLLMLVQSDTYLVKQTVEDFDRELSRYIKATGGNVKQVFHDMAFGCEAYLDDIKQGKSPNFKFLESIYTPCFVCEDLEKVGYKSCYFWTKAITSLQMEATLKSKLTSSDIVKAATSDQAIPKPLKQFNHNQLLRSLLPRENASDSCYHNPGAVVHKQKCCRQEPVEHNDFDPNLPPGKHEEFESAESAALFSTGEQRDLSFQGHTKGISDLEHVTKTASMEYKDISSRQPHEVSYSEYRTQISSMENAKEEPYVECEKRFTSLSNPTSPRNVKGDTCVANDKDTLEHCTFTENKFSECKDAQELKSMLHENCTLEDLMQGTQDDSHMENNPQYGTHGESGTVQTMIPSSTSCSDSIEVLMKIESNSVETISENDDCPCPERILKLQRQEFEKFKSRSNIPSEQVELATNTDDCLGGCSESDTTLDCVANIARTSDTSLDCVANIARTSDTSLDCLANIPYFVTAEYSAEEERHNDIIHLLTHCNKGPPEANNIPTFCEIFPVEDGCADVPDTEPVENG